MESVLTNYILARCAAGNVLTNYILAKCAAGSVLTNNILARCAARRAYTPPEAPTRKAFMSNTDVPSEPESNQNDAEYDADADDYDDKL